MTTKTTASSEKILNKPVDAMDLLPCSIYSKNLNGNIVFINDYGISVVRKYTEQNIEGKINKELFPENVAENLDQNDRLTLNSTEPQQFIEHGAGKSWLSIKKSIRNSENEVIGLIGTSLPIDVEDLEKLKGQQEGQMTNALNEQSPFSIKPTPNNIKKENQENTSTRPTEIITQENERTDHLRSFQNQLKMGILQQMIDKMSHENWINHKQLQQEKKQKEQATNDDPHKDDQLKPQ